MSHPSPELRCSKLAASQFVWTDGCSFWSRSQLQRRTERYCKHWWQWWPFEKLEVKTETKSRVGLAHISQAQTPLSVYTERRSKTALTLTGQKLLSWTLGFWLSLGLWMLQDGCSERSLMHPNLPMGTDQSSSLWTDKRPASKKLAKLSSSESSNLNGRIQESQALSLAPSIQYTWRKISCSPVWSSKMVSSRNDTPLWSHQKIGTCRKPGCTRL